MGKSVRIILVGKAASGKDFMREHLVDKCGLTPDISVTTRPPRTGEVDGVTYNFIDDEEFNRIERSGKLFECVRFNGWGYGTLMESWLKSDIFIMTPGGVSQIPEEDRKSCFIVYFDIPVERRRERLIQRSDADQVERRIAADEEDFQDFNDYDLDVVDPLFDPDELYNQISRLCGA